jgi:hypothetical protein
MRGQFLTLDFKAAELQAGILATEQQALAARTRALRKTGQRARNIVKRALSAQLKVPQKHLSSRFFLSSVSAGDVSVTLWIGSYNVEPHNIFSPVQQKSGVKAGSIFYQGAFYGDVYGPAKKIWIRKRSKFYDPELYPGGRSGSGGVPPRLAGRYPVVKASIKVEAAAEYILEQNKERIEQEFVKILGQELNYEVNVRG